MSANLMMQTGEVLQKTGEMLEAFEKAIHSQRGHRLRLTRDHLCHPAPDTGVSLKIKGYRQLDTYNCGPVTGWMVVNTFNPEFGFKRFNENCSPINGTEPQRLARALRAAGIGVGVRKTPLAFCSIKRNIAKGCLIVAVIDRPGTEYAHWVLVYGYSETQVHGPGQRKSKARFIYIAGNNWMGIGGGPNPVEYETFNGLSQPYPHLVCWRK